MDENTKKPRIENLAVLPRASLAERYSRAIRLGQAARALRIRNELVARYGDR